MFNNSLSRKKNLFGYACGLGAGDERCAEGPAYLYQTGDTVYQKLNILSPHDFSHHSFTEKIILDKITAICTRLGKNIVQSMQKNTFFVVIGGDHTSAIGTWSGAAYALRKTGDLGLIWIDAHLDAHTFQTTPSGNIHGMPMAALLGIGEGKLTQLLDQYPKIKPENICYIGSRSFEPEEYALIRKLRITVFTMTDIMSQGLENVFLRARTLVSKKTAAYGISLDLDAIDPEDAPGVGSPEKNGLSGKEICLVLEKHCCASANAVKLCGIEIAEFNPFRDKAQKTEKLITILLSNI